MKKTKKILEFKKNSIVELNKKAMLKIVGGATETTSNNNGGGDGDDDGNPTQTGLKTTVFCVNVTV